MAAVVELQRVDNMLVRSARNNIDVIYMDFGVGLSGVGLSGDLEGFAVVGGLAVGFAVGDSGHDHAHQVIAGGEPASAQQASGRDGEDRLDLGVLWCVMAWKRLWAAS